MLESKRHTSCTLPTPFILSRFSFSLLLKKKYRVAIQIKFSLFLKPWCYSVVSPPKSAYFIQIDGRFFPDSNLLSLIMSGTVLLSTDSLKTMWLGDKPTNREKKAIKKCLKSCLWTDRKTFLKKRVFFIISLLQLLISLFLFCINPSKLNEGQSARS